MIARANTIPPLVALLASSDARACEHASFALASIGLENESNQVQITQMLIEMLVTSDPGPSHERAVRALQALVRENSTTHYEIARCARRPPPSRRCHSCHRAACAIQPARHPVHHRGRLLGSYRSAHTRAPWPLTQGKPPIAPDCY